MSRSRTVTYRSSYPHEPWNCVIEKLLITFAEIAWVIYLTRIQTDPILHTPATANFKVCAEEALIAQILLVPGKGSFQIARSKLFERRFENIAQSPLRLNKKFTSKRIAVMFNHDKTGALPTVRANGVIAQNIIGY